MLNVEVSALRTLRGGLLCLSAATAMLIAAAELMPAVHGAAVLLLAAFAASIYAVAWKVRPAMRRLSEADGQFRVCYRGSTLMLVGLAVLALGAAVLAAAGTVLSGFALAMGMLLIGSLAVSIGYVMTFVAGAFKLYRKHRDPLYIAAGTLFVLDTFLTPIAVGAASTALLGLSRIPTAAGYALMYVAVGNAIKKPQ
jgi:hypothetical protein